MTRKHVEAVAAALKAVRDSYSPHWNPNLFRACTDNARAVARALAVLNPRFDTARFLRDCGVPS
jgi:hypothetical protein